MKTGRNILFLVLFCTLAMNTALWGGSAEKIRVILDTDANNELDDQHAIAYLLFNGGVFDVEGITVNRTHNGGGIDDHVAEARRVVALCGLEGRIPILSGADQSFDDIKGKLDQPDFDGAEAVDFIIGRAKADDPRKLVLLPVGKLTNIALALAKEPSIIPKVRVVWLGSNYPDPGEYNQVNDEPSLNYILDTGVEFEIVLVRYGKPSGTDAVRVTPEEIRAKTAGKGPRVSPVTGRHGAAFDCFGDYAINLFEHIDLHGDPPSRALFDMAAVAIVKNPQWATARLIPAPILRERRWHDRPDNPRKIVLWEHFDRDAIMADFYASINDYYPAAPKLAQQWEMVELTFKAEKEYANPYTDVELTVEFTGPNGQVIRRPGYWDGGAWRRVRFAAPETGRWSWRSTSQPPDAGLQQQGELLVSAYDGDNPLIRHGLLKMSPGKRNVIHHDGAPFLMVADTPWGLPFRGTVESATAYAQNRRERGFNAALLMSVQPDRRAQGPRDRNAVGGFGVAFADLPDGHLNQLNADYFQHLDKLIAILIDHGIVPVYNPVFQGFGWKGLSTLGAAADPQEYARYTRYLIARYGAYPAMWLVSADGTGKERVTEPAGLEIEEWDAYGQPTGIHYSPFDDRKADWTDDPQFGFHYNRSYHDAAWLDFQWCQTGHGGEHLPDKVRRMHDYMPTKAVANGEPTYERIGRPDNAIGWWQGHEAWLNLTAGGTMGVVYGAGSLWNWKIAADEPGWADWCNSNNSWAEAIEFEGSRYVGFVSRALAGYDITDMTKLPQVGPQAVGKPGELYIVYLPEGGAVKLAGLEGKLPYQWFNPRTGEFAAGGMAGKKKMTTPSKEPWVLLAGNRRE